MVCQDTKEHKYLLYEEICFEEFGDKDSRRSSKERFKENIRLANDIAHKYIERLKDSSFSIEDLYQQAYLGLWLSCLRYDEDSGMKFSSYAVPTIQGTILTALRETELLKTPRLFKDIKYLMFKHRISYPLSAEDIDLLLEKEGDRITKNQLLKYNEYSVISLDASIDKGDPESGFLSDIIEDPRSLGSIPDTSSETIDIIIEKCASYVNIKYRDMISDWLYSIYSGNPLTQMQLAEKHNIPQSMISRTISKMIRSCQENKNYFLSLL